MPIRLLIWFLVTSFPTFADEDQSYSKIWFCWFQLVDKQISIGKNLFRHLKITLKSFSLFLQTQLHLLEIATIMHHIFWKETHLSKVLGIFYIKHNLFPNFFTIKFYVCTDAQALNIACNHQFFKSVGITKTRIFAASVEMFSHYAKDVGSTSQPNQEITWNPSFLTDKLHFHRYLLWR